MRVAVVGGTRFIGRAVVEDLAAAGHEVLVVHRGQHEPSGPDAGVLAEVAHLHANRRELGPGDLAGFAPDAVVDLCAMTGPTPRRCWRRCPGTRTWWSPPARTSTAPSARCWPAR